MRKEIKDFTVIDLETTGFYSNNRILEFGAVRYRDGKPIATFQQYANYRGKLPDVIKKVTGITEEILKEKGIHKDDAYNKMMEFIGNDLLIAHNMEFDWSFLEYHNPICHETGEPLHELKNKTQCTLKMARKLKLNVDNNKLGTLCKHFDIEPEKYHSALCDAQATGELFLKLQDIIIENSNPITITVPKTTIQDSITNSAPNNNIQPELPKSIPLVQLTPEQLERANRSKAGIFGIITGYLGIHNFIYGYYIKGTIQLAITLLSGGFLAVFVWIWALVESILMLTKVIKPSNKDSLLFKKILYYVKNHIPGIIKK